MSFHEEILKSSNKNGSCARAFHHARLSRQHILEENGWGSVAALRQEEWCAPHQEDFIYRPNGINHRRWGFGWSFHGSCRWWAYELSLPKWLICKGPSQEPKSTTRDSANMEVFTSFCHTYIDKPSTGTSDQLNTDIFHTSQSVGFSWTRVQTPTRGRQSNFLEVGVSSWAIIMSSKIYLVL